MEPRDPAGASRSPGLAARHGAADADGSPFLVLSPWSRSGGDPGTLGGSQPRGSRRACGGPGPGAAFPAGAGRDGNGAAAAAETPSPTPARRESVPGFNGPSATTCGLRPPGGGGAGALAGGLRGSERRPVRQIRVGTEGVQLVFLSLSSLLSL